MRENNSSWILDSGCSRHMTGDRRNFLSLAAFQGGSVAFGGGKSGQIVGIGKIGRSLEHAIENVYCVDGLRHNLLSISQLCDRGNEVSFSSVGCIVKNLQSGEVVMEGKRVNNVYKASLKSLPENNLTCLNVQESDSQLWHKKMGHASLSQLNKLAS